MSHPYLAGPAPIAFAHQGGASEFPENTLPAFDNARSEEHTSELQSH